MSAIILIILLAAIFGGKNDSGPRDTIDDYIIYDMFFDD